MIEKYFKSNSLLRFTEILLPGTDNRYRPGFQTITTTSIGLTFLPPESMDWKNAITVYPRWLPWHAGFITETALFGQDVFSGPFTGCWMVAYQDGPMTYVGHIGTDSYHPENSKAVKRAWHSFAAAHENDLIVGFNPLREGTPPQPIQGQENPIPKCFGLITPDCTCYIIMAFTQLGVNPPTLRIGAIQRAFGKLPKAVRDIFSNDPEVHDMGLPFTLDDWKTSTSGGTFHTRSTQLKNLDTALAAYFQNPCAPTLNNVRIAFNTWRTEKRSEYQNPTRNRRNCVQELENYLAAN